MKTFKAAILRELGKPLSIEELILPDPEPTQVVVKNDFSGVCRSQLMEVSGGRGPDKWLPHLLGHEAVGTIYKVGAGVRKVTPGQKVVTSWLNSSGQDGPTPTFKTVAGETINAGKTATFAEFSIVPENKVFTKPAAFDDVEAVLLGCAIPTGAGMVLTEHTPNYTDKIVIIGLGGIGLSVLITCLALDLKNITVVDVNLDKLKIAEELGITECHHIKSSEFKEFLPQNKGLFDVCFEAGGTTSSIEAGFNMIKDTGVLVFASHPPSGEKISIDPHELIRGKKIIGTWGGGGLIDESIKKLEILKINKKLSIANLIGNFYEFENINIALNDLLDSKTIRPIIRF